MFDCACAVVTLSIELNCSEVRRMAEKAKRRKVVLTIDEKLEIIKSIDAGLSYTVIAEKYGIARSTEANIKKDSSKVEAFKKTSMEMGFRSATSKR